MLARSSSEPGLFAWKSLGEKKIKREVKINGHPNKLKNYSSVCLKATKEPTKYDTTTASTFTKKKAEMITRRNSFA